jgi:hypothetical protein
LHALLALHEDFPDLDGIAHRPRHDDDRMRYAFFDRAGETSFIRGAGAPSGDDWALAEAPMARYGAIWDPTPPPRVPTGSPDCRPAEAGRVPRHGAAAAGERVTEEAMAKRPDGPESRTTARHEGTAGPGLTADAAEDGAGTGGESWSEEMPDTDTGGSAGSSSDPAAGGEAGGPEGEAMDSPEYRPRPDADKMTPESPDSKHG